MTTAASPSAVRWCLCGVEAPASFASRLLRARVQSTVMLLPVGPLHHGTPKRDSVGTVLQRYSRLCANNRQGERAIHPPTQDRGLSGPCSVRPCLAEAKSGHPAMPRGLSDCKPSPVTFHEMLSLTLIWPRGHADLVPWPQRLALRVGVTTRLH